MSTYSILRDKEDACLRKYTFTGRVIDLGGHKGSSYFKLIKSEQSVEVANIDGEESKTHKVPSGADYIFDLEHPFPLPDQSYDHVLSFNVMEHLYNYRNFLNESARILKTGGTMHISVPFFFNIHASPNDYYRYTDATLVRLFTEYGFTDVKVEILGDGPCSAVFQNFGGSIPTMPLKLFCKDVAVFIDRTFSKCSKRYARIRERVPLGYFVSARKL